MPDRDAGTDASAAGFSIGGRAIGPGLPTFIVAELSANHHGDLEAARELVRAAAEAGADAVKLQTYTADTLTLRCDNQHFRVGAGTPWEGRLLHDLYREAATPWEWHAELFALAREHGMAGFSSPFDAGAVDFLEELGVPAHKVASFELVDVPLLEKVATTGKPVILSTGMATFAEIDEAVRTVRGAEASALALLHASSAYPARPDEIRLRCIPRLAEAFGAVAGLSDHTLGHAVPVAAVALGACIVEKHLCLSRSRPGPDAAFSLEPDELAAMVAAVRAVEQTLGPPSFGPVPREESCRALRRSLFVTRDVARGETLGAGDVRSVRPAAGLHPRHLPEVLGRRAARDLARGTPLAWDLLA